MDDLLLKLKEILRDHPKGLSVSDISKRLQMNRNSVAKYLDILTMAGHVEMRSYGTAKVFFLSQRVPASALLKYSSAFVAICDRHGKLIQISDNFLQFLAMERDAVVGCNLADHCLPLLSEPPLLARIRDPNFRQEYTYDAALSRGGQELFFRVKLIPTDFDDGSPGTTIVIEDTTAERRYERALRESEERFRAVADLSPFPIAIIDRDGTYLYINPRFTEVFGYTREDVPNGRAWFDRAFPDAGCRKEAISAWIADLASHGVGQTRPRQFAVRCRDGGTKTIVFRPVTLSDGRQYVTYEDITAIRTAEDELRQMVDTMQNIVDFLPDATFVIDSERRVIAWNRAMEDLTGVPRGEMLGRSDYAYAVPFYGSFRPILIDLVDREIPEIERRYRLFRRERGTVIAEGYLKLPHDSRERLLQGKAAPLFESRGKRMGAIQSIRDITSLHGGRRDGPDR
ncbi:MAG: PAS domain S-box protein [Methanomicrobiales archaeon]|nr:PAS domain S-box protein [Methanomicrobiales archaeon]MDI6877503.1 PAS domain S-box protein [Methanomicrobiales archaeon]